MSRRTSKGQPHLAVECLGMGLQLDGTDWCWWRRYDYYFGIQYVRVVKPKLPHLGQPAVHRLISQTQRQPRFQRKTVHACHIR